MLKKYVIALYCRLSRADAEFGQVVDESESIKNQVDQLMKYISEMPEYEHMKVLVFVDDGYTGRDFKRPDFIKLRKMILEKKVDCVIVKDFSRFGRDYIELGDYLEQIFPAYGIRFISVNDHYDTKYQTEPNPVDVGFKNLLYTYYSKDLSKKARKSVEQRKREGRFTCGPVRFGFVKKAGSKTELEIDEKAAEIIRYVFSMAQDGIKTKEIAVRLNEEGIMTPAMYSYEYNQKCKWNTVKKEQNNWTQSGVAKILRDERYTGIYIEYVEGEKGKECIRIPGRYPVIVSHETFYNAQMVMIDRKYPNKSKVSDNVLKGVIKCGHCNHALALSRGKGDRYYYCKNSKFDLSQGCPDERFSEQELKDCVLKIVQDYLLMLNMAGEGKVRELNQQYGGMAKVDKVRLEKEDKALEEHFFSLYEQYKSGEMAKELFVEKRKKINNRKMEVEEELTMLHEMESKVIEFGNRKKQIHHENSMELTEELVNKYIKRLIIYGQNDMRIIWKVKSPFESF